MLHKGESIRKLKRKMKRTCNKCYRKHQLGRRISIGKVKVPDIDYCFTKCPIHIFINLMIKEINGN